MRPYLFLSILGSFITLGLEPSEAKSFYTNPDALFSTRPDEKKSLYTIIFFVFSVPN